MVVFELLLGNESRIGFFFIPYLNYQVFRTYGPVVDTGTSCTAAAAAASETSGKMAASA